MGLLRLQLRSQLLENLQFIPRIQQLGAAVFESKQGRVTFGVYHTKTTAMKPFILITLALLLLEGLYGQQAEGVTLTVTLENVLSDQGDILAALHGPDTFMKGPGLRNFKSEARQGALTFTFEDVPPGRYAVSVLHDRNSNQRMDFDPSGMPQEPYGMSGNDMRMGPPTFEGAAFEVGSEPVALSIRF